MSQKYRFKFIVIGDSGVGKSCLLLRFSDNRFRPDHDLTIGVEFGAKEIEVEGDTVHLQVWDTAGQESFRSITRAYYKGATAAILVYDVTRRSSFQSLSEWVQEVSNNAHSNIVTMLIANKADLEDKIISTEEGYRFAQDNGFLFMETSAKTGMNVNEAFQTAAREVRDRVLRGLLTLDAQNISFRGGQPVPQKKGCCS